MVNIFIDPDNHRLYGLDSKFTINMYTCVCDLYDEVNMMVYDLPFRYVGFRKQTKLKKGWKYIKATPKRMLLLSRLHEGRTYSDNKF